MDDYKDLKEIIEKQAALNQKLEAMALELDSERAKNAKLCKEISCLKSLIGESGQELWSAENQRADRLETELGQVKQERDVAKERLAAYEDLGSVDHLRELVQAEKAGRLEVLPCKVGDTVWTNLGMSGWYFRDKDKPYIAKVVFVGLNNSKEMGGGLFNVVYVKGEHMLQFRFADIGKTVFLTREEAEAALKGENNA